MVLGQIVKFWRSLAINGQFPKTMFNMLPFVFEAKVAISRDFVKSFSTLANRKLKLAEFLRLMAALTMDEDQEGNVVLDSIRVFDTEERGFISTVELREALQCMPGSSQMRDFELKDILKRADPDGKGRIRIKGTTIFLL